MGRIEDTEESLLDSVSHSPGVLLTALEGADVGIFVLGPDFSVEWINGATEEFFGRSREAVIGEDKRDLVESTIKSIFDRPERFAETVIQTYEDNTYVEEFECHVLPGEEREERWLLHQSHPIETGELAGGRIEHYTDITERKARERELRQQNRRLDEFASVVSHDLRNPLNVVMSRFELIRDQCADENVEPIDGALGRMERIIEDLLWLAREGRDIGSTEPVDLQAAVETAWTIAADDANRAELLVSGSRLGTIDADDDRLRQLLENLFRNAIEHGDGDVTVGHLDDGFYVEDDGPGIAETERSDVFDAGYTTLEDGTGVGLSVVDQVVEAHGWDVSVVDGTGGGARFEITGVDTRDDL